MRPGPHRLPEKRRWRAKTSLASRRHQKKTEQGTPDFAIPPARPDSLEPAKQALRLQLHELLDVGNLDDKEGIELLIGVNEANSPDHLCILHNRLAHLERVRERSRRGATGAGTSRGRRAPPKPLVDAQFSLQGQTRLKSGQVDQQIKRHLPAKYHPFVSQAVNDMEFGRGKPTQGHPRMWHVSAGVAGVGSCSVFYYNNSETQQIHIVGIGHHLTRSTYRLHYAIAELGGSGSVLKIA